MVVTDLQLTDTGDLFFDRDIMIIDETDLVQQNMLRFLRSDTSDVILNPSMAFSFIDYMGLPNTRETADLIKNDFLDKISVLEAFQNYVVDVDIWPSDRHDLTMEITILGDETAPVIIQAPILLQNGFVTSLPSTFNVNIYDPQETTNVIERITLTEKANQIRVKYRPEIDDFVMFSSADLPDVDEDGNLANITTISGTLALTSVSVSLDEEIPALSGNKLFDSLFSVEVDATPPTSGTIDLALAQTEDDPSTYEFRIDSEDKMDITFGDTYSGSIDYTIRYEDVIALASSVIETPIEIPRPDDIPYPYATDNNLHYIALDRYIDPGTYVVQYRANAIL